MRLLNSLLAKTGLRRREPPITRRQALQVRPLRNPQLEWEYNEEGSVVATLTRRAGLRGRLITFFLAVPESRPIVLDEVGTFVWDMCDGEHSVEQLVQALAEKYKLSQREVEISLNEYLRMLGKRGMIAIAVPKEITDELSEAAQRALGLQEIVAEEEEPPPLTGEAGKQDDEEEDGS